MNDSAMNVLFIDNFDSFTYNLVDEFEKRGCRVLVYRADTILDDLIGAADTFSPDLIVLSPGPGNPDTAGVTLAAIGHYHDKLPIFGVCLGHQAIVQYFGGKIIHAPQAMHGKASRISHHQKGIFRGIENPLQAGRYHSLCAMQVPECLETVAEYESIVMAVQHTTLPIYGVQFHPESILTPTGGRLIENLIETARQTRSSQIPQTA